jgi:hypothetical protein
MKILNVRPSILTYSREVPYILCKNIGYDVYLNCPLFGLETHCWKSPATPSAAYRLFLRGNIPNIGGSSFPLLKSDHHMSLFSLQEYEDHDSPWYLKEATSAG